jgi:hypothetical protein
LPYQGRSRKNRTSNHITGMINKFFFSTIGESDIYVPFQINWVTTSNNNTNPACVNGGWVISEQNTKIRYNISDSANCVSGGCPITQEGTAIANIRTGSQSVIMTLNFEGLGEAQDAGAFERIEFLLNSQLLARGSSAGGGLHCAPAVPIVKAIIVPGPYLLSANTDYEFRINFTTGDALYHVGAYYEIKLIFS